MLTPVLVFLFWAFAIVMLTYVVTVCAFYVVCWPIAYVWFQCERLFKAVTR